MTIQLSPINGYWRAVILDDKGHTTYAISHGETRAEAVGYLMLNFPICTGTRIVEGYRR